MIAGASVTLLMNSTTGVRRLAYIYGTNQFNGSTAPVNLGLQRLGGNRWTGYNWETNYSNAGSDYIHNNDLYLTDGQVLPPGGAITPALQAAATQGNALLVTVPMAGYVSADASGPVSASQTAPSIALETSVAKKSSVRSRSAAAYDDAGSERRLRIERRVCVLGEKHEAAGATGLLHAGQRTRIVGRHASADPPEQGDIFRNAR